MKWTKRNLTQGAQRQVTDIQHLFQEYLLYFVHVVRKRSDGNDQESIQLPQTSHPSHQRENNTNIKQFHHTENVTRGKPKGQLLSHKLAERLSKSYQP